MSVIIVIEYDYKFRAECTNDVDRFIDLLKTVQDSFISIERKLDPEFTEVDVEFSSMLNIDEIREIIRNLDDGHVMIETLNYAHEYTGDRYYEY